MIFLTQTLTYAVNFAPTTGTLTPTQTSVAVYSLCWILSLTHEFCLSGGCIAPKIRISFLSFSSLSFLSIHFGTDREAFCGCQKCYYLERYCYIHMFVWNVRVHVTPNGFQEYDGLVKHLGTSLCDHTSSTDWCITVLCNITSWPFVQEMLLQVSPVVKQLLIRIHYRLKTLSGWFMEDHSQGYVKFSLA